MHINKTFNTYRDCKNLQIRSFFIVLEKNIPIVPSQVTKMDEGGEQLDLPILLNHVNEVESGDQLGKTTLPNQVNEAEALLT